MSARALVSKETDNWLLFSSLADISGLILHLEHNNNNNVYSRDGNRLSLIYRLSDELESLVATYCH